MASIVGHPQAMLTEIYIEALLVDEMLADRSGQEFCSRVKFWTIRYGQNALGK